MPRGVRKPTALKVLEGHRPDRINRNEPKPQPGVPTCPVGTTAEVREVWDYTAKQLAAMRVLSKADRDALLIYCEAVVLHRKASQDLHERGVTVLGHLGTPIRNPAAQSQKDASTTIRAYAREFGLTPASRAGFTVSERDDAPAAARLLS